MSDPPDLPEASGASRPAEAKAPVATRYRRTAIGLASALLVVLGSVASAPFWAPLLPWAPAAVPAPTSTSVAPAAPADQAAPAPQDNTPQTEPVQDQPPQGASEQSEPKNEPASGQRQPQNQPRPPDETAESPAVQLLDRRVGALEARPAATASDIAEIRQQLARLASSLADLDARVAAIGKAAPAQAATDSTDMALVLALLQIRGALEVGRPFAPEYEALAALARARPEIAAVTAPLAEPAKTGLATRAVLAARLRELARAIAAAKIANDAAAKAPAEASADAGATALDWTDQALKRLRGLVTIRRVDGGERQPGGSPDAPVNAAEMALAGGDLDGAVGALDKLTGAPAEAAGPWLRMAKQRLAVEAALHRIEALLVARLGTSQSSPGAGSPR